jgi:hypothetical protein
MGMLHRVPLLLLFYPRPLLLHIYIILAFAHAKDQVRNQQSGEVDFFCWPYCLGPHRSDRCRLG